MTLRRAATCAKLRRMTQENAAPERPLSPPERILWWFDHGAPLHFTTVLDCAGPLTEAALRAALDALQTRHPLLRARITGTPHALRFTALNAPLPLHIEPAEPERYAERLGAELALPMPSLDAPLLRCTWLRDADAGGRLLLTLHHSIGDGRSGVLLARDLARAAAGEALTPLPEPPPLWDARPSRARGLRGWSRQAGTLLRDALRMLRARGRPIPFPVDAVVPLHERRPGVHPLTFDAAFTERLTARARAEGTTVHGVLSVVLMQALATEHPGPVPMACGSPVDVRPVLGPAVTEALGYYVGLSQSIHRVDPAAPVWPLARRLRDEIRADVVRNVPTIFHLLAEWLFGVLTRDGATPAQLAARMYALPLRGTTGITNLGRLDVPERIGDLRLTGLFFVVAPSAMADFVSTATCFAGRLHWNFIALAPAVAPERATRLVAEVERRLRSVVDAG
jgi:hypothetical protein